MYPVLFQYGPYKLYSFAFFYNVVIACCAIGLSLEMERLRWKIPKVPFFFFWLPKSWKESIWFSGAWIATAFMVIGFLGAHLGYGLFHGIKQGWQYGLGLGLNGWIFLIASNMHDSMWFGGFAACALFVWILAIRMGTTFLKFADVAVLLAVLGQVPGRIACFLGGCCFGKPTDLPWGIAYDSAASLFFYHKGTHLHPSQLYEMLVALVLFIYMYKKRTSNTFDGQNLIRYFVWGGLARFITEFFRAEPMRGIFWAGLSISQVIGLGLAVLGVIMQLVLSKRAAAKAVSSPVLAQT